MADKIARVPLDQNHLCFYSSYDIEDGTGREYSIDYEVADDEHYQMTEDEANKLETYLKANYHAAGLLAGLQTYIAQHGFWKLQNLFEQAGISPKHFCFYSIE
jgi:hypothetical protein